MGGNNPEGQSLSGAGASVGQRRKAPPGAGGMWGQEAEVLLRMGTMGQCRGGLWVGEPDSQGQRAVKGSEGVGPPPWGSHCWLDEAVTGENWTQQFQSPNKAHLIFFLQRN